MPENPRSRSKVWPGGDLGACAEPRPRGCAGVRFAARTGKIRASRPAPPRHGSVPPPARATWRFIPMLHRRVSRPALARWRSRFFGLVLGVPGGVCADTAVATAQRDRRVRGHPGPVSRFESRCATSVSGDREMRQDAWVRYPPEPVGMVWLIRQPRERASRSWPSRRSARTWRARSICRPRAGLCPCHTSNFNLKGGLNKVSPAAVSPSKSRISRRRNPDAEVRVRFRRFQTMTERRVLSGRASFRLA